MSDIYDVIGDHDGSFSNAESAVDIITKIADDLEDAYRESYKQQFLRRRIIERVTGKVQKGTSCIPDNDSPSSNEEVDITDDTIDIEV